MDFAAADEKIANVDGATRIRNQLEAKPHELGLDFYHLAENVYKSWRIVFGDDSNEGRTWAENLLHTLKHEGDQPAWEQLLTWRRALRSRTKKAEADRLINYPEFQKRGWQIGSGPTESHCKTSTSRLKGRGRR